MVVLSFCHLSLYTRQQELPKAPCEAEVPLKNLFHLDGQPCMSQVLLKQVSSDSHTSSWNLDFYRLQTEREKKNIKKKKLHKKIKSWKQKTKANRSRRNFF